MPFRTVIKYVTVSIHILSVKQNKNFINEPHRDKTNKMIVRPAKTQISLCIRPVWSESSPSAWRKLWCLATHWAHSEDSDQTGRTGWMPRLIWVFAGRTCHFVGFVTMRLISVSGLLFADIAQPDKMILFRKLNSNTILYCIHLTLSCLCLAYLLFWKLYNFCFHCIYCIGKDVLC